jgi:4'-phosphopantetheinyl transferase
MRPQQEEVHLWRLNLDGDEEARFCLLSDSEQARAERFHFERDKRRWITGRSLLRVILGRSLGAAPETLSFEMGPWGKPGLPGCSLRFSMSHSGGAALLALAWQQEVGVDMEAVCRDFSAEELAPQVLSARERAWLRERAPEQRSRAFLTLWTAKEAYVKATGQGLSFPLTRLTLLPNAGTDQFDDLSAASSCPIFVRQIDGGPGYLAALAVEGAPASSVQFFDFRL